jgi:hypothetical protein
MVRHFEGEKSSRIAARWLDAQPEGLSVIRSPSGIEGFSLQVIFPADPGLVDADPIVRAALEVAADLSPARPGEQISIARFMAGRQEYQRDAYAVLAASISSAILWISRPFAWSLVTTVDPEFWSPGFEYLGLRVVARATFDGREYTTFGIDWRRLPVDVWLTVMAERELTGEHSPIPEQLLRPAPLSRTRFDDAVRAGLRDLNHPDRLRDNALVNSRLVGGHSSDPAGDLRAAMTAAISRLGQQRNPALSKVLDRTFVRAAPTQEAAAQVLDLPFSTYRRHLGKAVDELTDALWSVEIGHTPP